MITIFVAKDADEFNRYGANLKRSHVRSPVFPRFQPIEGKTSEGCLAWKFADCDDLGFVIKVDDSLKKTTRSNLSSSNASRHAGKFLMEICRQIEAMQNSISEDYWNIKKILSDQSVSCHVTIQSDAQVVETGDQPPPSGMDTKEDKTGSDVFSILCDVRLFIHWGGGAPLDYELDFQEAYAKDSEPSTPLKFMSKIFPKLQAFALSSRRNEFDVMCSEITVPRTHGELDELVQRFTFAQVKNILTEYVANVKNKHQFYLKDDGVLRQYLKYMMEAGISKSFPSNDTKWMKKVIETELKSFLEYNRSVIDYKDDIVALFTLLIREGVCHG